MKMRGMSGAQSALGGRLPVWSIPGTIVTGIDPEPAGIGAAAAAGILHRERCVVGEQLLRGEDVFGKSRLQRLEPPAGTADPVRQSRAVDLDALLCR
jgi:hypothetical protein